VDAHPDARFEGRVVQVRNAPVTLQNVVTYDVVIGVPNPDLALKPGMTATVSVTTGRRDDAVRVPVRALRFRPELAEGRAAPAPADERESAVHRPDGGASLRRIPVSVGLRDDRHAELLEGELAPGDAVVVAQARRADEGAAPSGSPFFPQRRR
jgi:HlyD family secretion protein